MVEPMIIKWQSCSYYLDLHRSTMSIVATISDSETIYLEETKAGFLFEV